MSSILNRNRAHFKKYLPKDMTWEEFDNIVFQITKEIAVFKKLRGDCNNSVSKNDIGDYLVKKGYEFGIQYCIGLSMVKLRLDKRVIRLGGHVGIGSILPVTSLVESL